MRHLFNNLGFTIVELVVAITTLGILTPLVIITLGSIYDSNTQSVNTATLESSTRITLRQIESDITNGTGFLNTVSVTTPFGAPATPTKWVYNADPAGNSNNVLIAKTQATDSTNTQLAISNSSGQTCNPAADKPISNLVVYYVAQDPQNSSQYNLYKRTIVNWDAQPTCASVTTYQKSSCARNITNSACKAIDGLLLYNIKSFKLTYYATPTTSTASADADIPTAQTVKIDISASSTDKRVPLSTATIRVNRAATY